MSFIFVSVYAHRECIMEKLTMFMLLLWLFPWSWRCKIPCMSKRVAHATLILPSLTMPRDAKDKTELIFMAGNSRHSSSNKWDALHKASWRSLKIIVVERRLFEKSQFLTKNRMVPILQEMALRVFCLIQQKKSQHLLKRSHNTEQKKMSQQKHSCLPSANDSR